MIKRKEWERKRSLIKRYDSLSESYDILYKEEQTQKINKALERIKLRCSDTVLDIGCGTGLLLEHIYKLVRFIVGIDISRGVLNIANKRARNIERKCSIAFIRADANHLPLKSSIFSKVFAFTLLQNVPNFILTISKMAEVSKKDSVIVITALKKIFSKERFEKILNETQFDYLMIEDDSKVYDHIALCRNKKVKT